ncbi:AMP nucleosidase [Robiginitomaculum antarcticum]|uniref:AMP nucleosidase n=1 Tax=Robiginitomaculum antarcticum TaxID=437507 RepID=UPI0012EABCE0|nr:AMP nucleosidase [Robiginitomaculum antarcticum]
MFNQIGDKPEFFEHLTECETIAEAVDKLGALYDDAVEQLNTAFDAFAKTGEHHGGKSAHYPYLLLNLRARKADGVKPYGFVSIRGTGWYGSSITHPEIFENYLKEQLGYIDAAYEIDYYVGYCDEQIPVAFAIDPSTYDMKDGASRQIGHYFVLPNLKKIHDDLADGAFEPPEDEPLPLSLFPALRTDYSLQRLKHYTATPPSHFQKFVIFTNYQRYVDEFIDHAKTIIDNNDSYSFSAPGSGKVETSVDYNPDPKMKLPQMPAYHLMGENNEGITIINIGVGPSNAKTITDHLAVLRSHCWLMLGHCGGLRNTQVLGDFVLAHAYLRDDQILDDVLPPSIPLPTIAEVQIALTEAISEVMQLSGQEMKQHVRTGTVVTTDDRNWEMRYAQLRTRLNQSRAIAIDMESATIAANGYRYRVPYGTLLCVSDRPLHGEIKLPGSAEVFYRSRIAQHLNIGLKTMSILKNAAQSGTLHSRKLRSLDDPVFR